MRGASSAIRRGLKSRATMRRSLLCTGGSENGIVIAPPNGSGPRENMNGGIALENVA